MNDYINLHIYINENGNFVYLNVHINVHMNAYDII